MGKAKHFVLVHGICLGAWCWYRLVTMLKLAGHKVTALDLGSSGINPNRLDEIASASDYFQPLMKFMASLPQNEKLILVGHSYGGLCISLAMENFPDKILAAVFVAAYMPHLKTAPATLIKEYFKRTPIESFMDCQFTFGKGLEKPATSAIFGPEYMKAKLFKQCKLEDLELAKMLIRPGGFYLEDFASEFLLTEAKFGSVKRVFIVCEGDEVMEEEFQRFMIEMSPANEVKLIRGAGHMVMLSKPETLCSCMEEIADKC